MIIEWHNLPATQTCTAGSKTHAGFDCRHRCCCQMKQLVLARFLRKIDYIGHGLLQAGSKPRKMTGTRSADKYYFPAYDRSPWPVAPHDGIAWDIFGNDCPGRHNSPFADSNTRQYDRPAAYPCIILNNHWIPLSGKTGRLRIMLQGPYPNA